VTTFITRSAKVGPGVRLAVKDLIDVAGYPTTAGCRAVAAQAESAERDAHCMRGTRDAELQGQVSIIGKANLHELACGATGINPWFGTPVNPLDATLIPGGSSSGSAVAVASGEADIAFGTDTAGSIRIPSACCGSTGLKTTQGRVPNEGVFPVCEDFDTVGPMGRRVKEVAKGMCLLEPGFSPAAEPAHTVGRLRLPEVDGRVDEAVDRALRDAEFEIVDIVWEGWDSAAAAALTIIAYGLHRKHAELLRSSPASVGADVASAIESGKDLTTGQVQAAQATIAAWRSDAQRIFSQVEVVATPTLPCIPPRIGEDRGRSLVAATLPVSAAGLPALALPVPLPASPHPTSLQLIGTWRSEEVLLTTGAHLESAIGPGI
jgi:amidase